MANFPELTVKEVLIGLAAAAVLALLGYLGKQLRRAYLFGVRGRRARKESRILGLRLRGLGVRKFYVGREDWARFREPPNLTDYLRQAKVSLAMICYWLAQGSIQGVPAVLAQLAEDGVEVDVVLLDPLGSLPSVLARDLELPATSISAMVLETTRALEQVRGEMSAPARERFRIRYAQSVAQAAVILMDASEASGRIQLEFRPYRTARTNSFSLEFVRRDSGERDLYTVLELAWGKFVVDASVVPVKLPESLL